MIPLLGESVLCTVSTGNVSRMAQFVRLGPSSSVRTAVSWASACSCGIPRLMGNKVIGSKSLVRKPQQLISLSEGGGRMGPMVLQNRWLSSSSVVTSAVAATKADQGSPTADASSRSKWDLFAGVVVERKPVITANKNEIEERFAKYLAQLEFELSKKSDHEIRRANDEKMLEKVKSGELDLGNVQTARDDEDKWAAEVQNFQPASRTTEADKKNDIRSLERALDSHLLLVVEQKLGDDYRWVCPHSKLEEGETLRQAAERMIRILFPEMKTKILGHAPWGFYSYKYPKSPNTTSTGAKVFFYKAQVVAGETNKGSDSAAIIKDFAWLKRDELLTKLQPEYYKKLSECLIDE